MEFRIKARTVAFAVFATAACIGGPLSFAVRQGTLTVTDQSVTFEDKRDTSRSFDFDEIQQLTLTPSSVRILTYEDSRRKFGRDREYRFDHLPAGAAARLYPVFAQHLDQRFVSAVIPDNFQPMWKLPARLLRGLAGDNGMLLVGSDRIVFTASRESTSRTWRFSDIQNVSTAGPFDLTLTTFEKTGFARASDRLVRLQLKQRLAANAFDDLWRRLEEAHGVHIYQTQLSSHEDKHQ